MKRGGNRGENKANGRVSFERYLGTLLVRVPPLKWYQLGVPYTSEMERILNPAMNHEERAIIIAPDRTTRFFLKLESFPAHIPIVVGEQEAKRRAETEFLA